MLKATLLALTLLTTPTHADTLATPDEAVAILLQTATLWPESLADLATPVLQGTSLEWAAGQNAAEDQRAMDKRRANITLNAPGFQFADDPWWASLMRFSPDNGAAQRAILCTRAGKPTLDQVRTVKLGGTIQIALLGAYLSRELSSIPEPATVAIACAITLDLAPSAQADFETTLKAQLAPHFSNLHSIGDAASLSQGGFDSFSLVASGWRGDPTVADVQASFGLRSEVDRLVVSITFLSWRMPASM